MPSVTMTYAELAARLGRTEPAAKSLAKRKRWRRSIGNDGLARITVDEDELAGMADPDRRGIGRPPANSVRTSVTEPGSNPDCGEIELGSNPVHKLQARLAVVEALAGERLASLDRERERADRLAAEVTDLARQLARAAEDATAREREHQGQLVEVEKMAAGAERARAEAEKQAAVTREKADTLAAQLDLERHRAGELCQERDQVLERLDRAVERLNQVQAEHHAEVMAVREQMARAEHDHHRAAAELAAHLALPWWRRLFA